jgi:hypothetical protein
VDEPTFLTNAVTAAETTGVPAVSAAPIGFAPGAIIGGQTMPLTLDVSDWSAAASNWTLALLVGLTLFGFYASRAGQPLFGSILREER